MPLLLKGEVTDLVCPYGGADGLAEQGCSPRAWTAWIPAVAIEERVLQVRAVLPLPSCQPREVRDRGPPFGPTQVDHLHRATIHEPVPGVPVSMRGNQLDDIVVVGGDDRTQPGHRGRHDAVVLHEPPERLRVSSGLVLTVLGDSLAMESGEQASSLTVCIWVPRSLREVLHQVSRQVLHDHYGGLRRGTKERADGPGLEPGPSPISAGGDLASNMVIPRATRLDDEVLTLMTYLQHHGVDQTPAVVRGDFVTGVPAREDFLLVR